MKTITTCFFLVFFGANSFGQKEMLQLGDRYADDQIYVAVSYAQFYNQPSQITKSNFSYSLSTGFIKDLILNKQATIISGNIFFHSKQAME